ncbi:MAG: DUF1844 domain-containing protein, partial [Nitrospinales bacterium]
MSDEEIKGPGFVFRDRRRSQQTDEEIREEESSADAQAEDKTKSGEGVPKDIEIDFSTFILSLTSSAFYHLGEMPDPNTGEKKVDLSAVKQTIDILLILKEKTQGNLDDAENNLKLYTKYGLFPH